MHHVLEWVTADIGIGIAFVIEIAIDEYFDSDSDSDPESGFWISLYQLYLRSRN